MAFGVYKVTFKTADYFTAKSWTQPSSLSARCAFTVTRTNEKLRICFARAVRLSGTRAADCS